ncbi:MAG TPA: hypothetical protein VJ385_22480 [Fibrobacteria bacterium]|nr:hypothetical protein [Fibrobacteria bacterium]
MLSEDYEKMMLIYLSGLVEGPGFRKTEELNRLSSHELLQLSQKVDDSALGLFVQLLKSSESGDRLFEKLMGDHEEENRALVDAFFSRYLKVVLSNVQEGENFNPLEVYLPTHTFDDLAFVQSRQGFFLRQTIDTINEYLDGAFRSKHHFGPGEQQSAWEYFWGKVMEK